MSIHEGRYQEAFASLGRPVQLRDATPSSDLAAAERRLFVRVPDSLKAFYRVGGKAADLLDHYDHLLAPEQWSLDAGKVTFFVENQAVVLYATEYGRLRRPADPPVFMSNNQAPYDWHSVCPSTSQFLEVMLRWEGAFGGAMQHTATAPTTPDLAALLTQRSWRYVGEVNDMRAYSKPLLALCHVQWSDGWRVFVGSTSESGLAALQDELGIRYDEPCWRTPETA